MHGCTGMGCQILPMKMHICTYARTMACRVFIRCAAAVDPSLAAGALLAQSCMVTDPLSVVRVLALPAPAYQGLMTLSSQAQYDALVQALAPFFANVRAPALMSSLVLIVAQKRSCQSTSLDVLRAVQNV